ncbi:uncharacterized protein A4U43_C01F16060 [Asparagus officinalis]|uniref:Uncharacterized protein n=1 Tax=Asparagus officinalis TaxID=4686 RepID=A0A5P1FS86_ASPOF|nr:uncharacterized protein A4U43_C01F16060 [Asparagus officinalis]
MPAMGLAEARTEIPHWQCWLREEMAATRLVPGGDLDEGRAEGGGDFAGDDDGGGLRLVLGVGGVVAVEGSKPKISCTSASKCYRTSRSRWETTDCVIHVRIQWFRVP